MDDSVDKIAGGDEEAGAGVAVAEEQDEGGEQDGEGEDAEQCGGEPAPDGERKAIPGHAFAAEADDGDEGIDRGHGGGDCEDGDREEPEIHAEALARTGAGDGAEGRIGGPAGEGGASFSESRRTQHDKGGSGEPKAEGVNERESHAAAADLGREDEVAKTRLGGGGEDEEEHDRTVDGHDGEVAARKDMFDMELRPGKVETHLEGERRADDDRDEGEDKVLDADGVVVGGEDAAAYGCGGYLLGWEVYGLR